MRDLRSNVRTFTEPIKVITKKEAVVDGIVTKADDKVYDVYANVMLDKGKESLPNSSQTPNQSLKITIHFQDFDIVPEITEVDVRGVRYIVSQVDSFGINTEFFNFVVRRR